MTLVYSRSDGFAWIRSSTDENHDLPPHYFGTLPSAVRAARELGFEVTHWADGEDPKSVALRLDY